MVFEEYGSEILKTLMADDSGVVMLECGEFPFGGLIDMQGKGRIKGKVKIGS